MEKFIVLVLLATLVCYFTYRFLVYIEKFFSPKKTAKGNIVSVDFIKGHSNKETYFIGQYPYYKETYIPNKWIYLINSNGENYTYYSSNDLNLSKGDSITFDFILSLFFKNISIIKINKGE